MRYGISAARRPLARALANASAMVSIPVGAPITVIGTWPPSALAHRLERLGQVLVAAPGQADEIKLGVRVGQRPRDRVRALQRGNDPLQPRRALERVERLRVGDREVAGAALVAQPGMLGTRSRIVQSG